MSQIIRDCKICELTDVAYGDIYIYIFIYLYLFVPDNHR